MRQSLLVAAIASSIALSAFAQESSPPAAAPAAADAAKSSDGWTDAHRSEDAIRQAREFLAAAGKAYRDAPSIVETITVGVVMPGGERSEESMTVEYGPKNSFRMAMGGMKLLALDGMAYFVPDEPADKYIERKVEGGLGKTFGAMLPGYSSPTGALAMRDGVEGDALVETFAGMFLQGAKLGGFRSGEKAVEVLLVGDGGQMIVAFDPATKLQTGMNATLTPPGMPEAMTIALEMKVDNKVADQLATPVVFEKGSRTAASDVMELMGGAGEPEMKIKVGDPVPAGVLARLDGGSFDIAKDGKGKVVVIDFWATWCAPCRKGLPLLDKFATEMKSNDKVAVFAVNVWEEEEGSARIEKVKSFWTGQKLGVETLIDADSSFIESFGFSGIPAFVVIGPDGKVAAMHVGYDANLVETLTKDVNAALAAK
jgi:thiol-disulfide isomerase/thioredoxin